MASEEDDKANMIKSQSFLCTSLAIQCESKVCKQQYPSMKIPEKSKPLERAGRKAMGSKADDSAKTARLPVFHFAF